MANKLLTIVDDAHFAFFSPFFAFQALEAAALVVTVEICFLEVFARSGLAASSASVCLPFFFTCIADHLILPRAEMILAHLLCNMSIRDEMESLFTFRTL